MVFNDDSAAASSLKALLERVTQESLRSQSSPMQHFIGVLLFASIVACLTMAPSNICTYYLALASIGLPYRIFSFWRRGWMFYLVDFCYAANALVIAYLLYYPPWVESTSSGSGRGFFALVYVVGEGPLAAALLAWQCAWVFGNIEHTLSTLIHLLPGLCMFCLRHSHAQPTPPRPVRPLDLSTEEAIKWLILGPIAFHCIWQLIYYVIVQLVFRSFILKRSLETSYRGLAMRAKKSDNWLHRFIRRGSTLRRITLYAAFQLAFTLVSMGISILSFYSPHFGWFWQVKPSIDPVQITPF